jgi:hypothetical protein
MISVRSPWYPVPGLEAWRYDLYYAPLDSENLSIGQLERLDIWYLRNQSYFKFKVKNRIAVGIGLVNNQALHGSIMTINFTDTSTPTIMQNINQYTGLTNFEQQPTVLPVDIKITNDYNVLIADQAFGLVVYDLVDTTLLELHMYSFDGLYGRVSSVAIGNNPAGVSAIVGTDQGIVEIIVGSSELFRFYPTVDVYGNFDVAALTAVEASPGFIVTNNVKVDRNSKLLPSVSILDRFSKYANQTTVRAWKDDEEVPIDFVNSFAPFAIFQDRDNLDLFYYVRQDNDGLRSYNVTIGEWYLSGTILNNADFTVTATERYSPTVTASSPVKAGLLSNDGAAKYNILKGEGYRPQGNEVHAFQASLTNVTMQHKFPVSSYFSGPCLDYTITFEESDQFAFTVIDEPKVRFVEPTFTLTGYTTGARTNNVITS